MTPRLPNKGGSFDQTQNEYQEDLCRRLQPQLQTVAEMEAEKLN
jgi:hypothetical protein